MKIVHQFYDESKATVNIIFSLPLNTQIDLSTVKTSFLAEGTNEVIPSTQEPPTINKDNNKELLIKITPSIPEVNKATVKIVFEDPSIIVAEKSAQVFLRQKEVTITPVNYYKPASEATVAGTAKGAQTATNTILAVSVVFSVSTALAMIKIQQMLDFLLLLNVYHPSNVKSFLQILSQSVFEDIPNGLGFLTDDSCNIELRKFLEEEVSCQVFENLGNFIVLVVLFVLAKTVFYWLHQLTKERKGRVSDFLKARNDSMGLTFWLDLIEGIQLDVFMTFFLGMMKSESESEKSKVSEVNFLVGSLLAFVAIFANLGVSFLTHRAFQATSKHNNTADKFIRDNYKKYEYLIEDYKDKTFFQRFFRPLSNAKDLLISFSLVVLHDIPLLQIGTITLWLLGMVVGTVVQRPYKEKKENFIEGLRGFIYLGCCLVMMLQSAVQNRWTIKKQYQFVGYPMIAMIGVLIAFNIGLSIYETYSSIKEIVVKVKRAMCGGGGGNGEPKTQGEGGENSLNQVQDQRRRKTRVGRRIGEDSKMVNLNEHSGIGNADDLDDDWGPQIDLKNKEKNKSKEFNIRRKDKEMKTKKQTTPQKTNLHHSYSTHDNTNSGKDYHSDIISREDKDRLLNKRLRIRGQPKVKKVKKRTSILPSEANL